MNIYEIDSALEALIDPETGELLDEDAFIALQMERNQKIENTVLWYKNTVAEYEAVKAESEALRKRSDALKSKSERLKEWINHILNGEKFKTARCSVTFRSSESVECENEAATIQWAEKNGNTDCLSYKPPSILKTALKEKLRSGIEIPGAHIVKKTSVVVK